MSDGRLIRACVGRLSLLQHRDGSWSDFQLAPGTSTSWVTGYTGCALAVAAADPRVAPALRQVAGRVADRAVSRVLTERSRSGGWGYRPDVRPDADSTAWVLRLIALRRPAGWRAEAAAALAFLERHATPGGYRTYADASTGRWSDPSPDITAAVLMAGHAAGNFDRSAHLRTAQRLADTAEDGRWQSLWWTGDGYPTAVVTAALALVQPGRVGAFVRVGMPEARASAFRLATELWTAASAGDSATAALLRRRLAEAGRNEGRWPGSADLVAPAPHGAAGPVDRDERSVDARGVFTTATVLHAAVSTARGSTRQSQRVNPSRLRSVRRLGLPGSPFDDEVSALAAATGADSGRAVGLFRTLTAQSLAASVRWPSKQLSELAGGTPLEFSVGAFPGLRFTTEVGDPRLPPHRRMLEGLAAIRRTVAAAGLDAEWLAARTALAPVLDPDEPVPADNRFWLWAGMDVTPAGTTVKAYASLLAGHPPGWRHRLDAFLDALHAPADCPARSIVRLLGTTAWGHEVGVGVTRGGWGAKIYFETHGFRPDLFAEALRAAGLSDDIQPMTPEIPGLLRASLAERSRAGIALRVVPDTGAVTEMTVACAFPPPLVGRDAVAERVQRWLDDRGAGAPHAAAVGTLLPSWASAAPAERLHSLFTLSRSPQQDEIKVYLRSMGRIGDDAVSI